MSEERLQEIKARISLQYYKVQEANNLMNSMVTEAHTKETKEIERLKERIEDLNTINEEHQILNGMIRKELQQKENIIKEVREYIKDNVVVYAFNNKDLPHWEFNDDNVKELLEILDKGSDKE